MYFLQHTITKPFNKYFRFPVDRDLAAIWTVNACIHGDLIINMYIFHTNTSACWLTYESLSAFKEKISHAHRHSKFQQWWRHNQLRVGVLRRGKVVWRFISERNVIISMGLSFRNLRKLRPPNIFAKIITTGVRTESKMRLGVLRYYVKWLLFPYVFGVLGLSFRRS